MTSLELMQEILSLLDVKFPGRTLSTDQVNEFVAVWSQVERVYS